jgi:hypothetical protein
MTLNYLEFHTIKLDEPKLLPPVKIQRHTKITKKKKKKKEKKSGRCAWREGEQAKEHGWSTPSREQVIISETKTFCQTEK